ncbi:MAG: hypothetical protein H0X50_06070 [Nitrosopumilus sp.]|nr:hypothetical protein [Nitrosopumilus sp.]
MTTNGLLLKDKIKKLKESGLQSVNISLDTLIASRFKSMSGIDSLDKVIESIRTEKEFRRLIDTCGFQIANIIRPTDKENFQNIFVTRSNSENLSLK